MYFFSNVYSFLYKYMFHFQNTIPDGNLSYCQIGCLTVISKNLDYRVLCVPTWFSADTILPPNAIFCHSHRLQVYARKLITNWDVVIQDKLFQLIRVKGFPPLFFIVVFIDVFKKYISPGGMQWWGQPCWNVIDLCSPSGHCICLLYTSDAADE